MQGIPEAVRPRFDPVQLGGISTSGNEFVALQGGSVDGVHIEMMWSITSRAVQSEHGERRSQAATGTASTTVSKGWRAAS